MRRASLICVFTAVVLTSSCSDSTTESTSQVNIDLNSVLSQLIAGGVPLSAAAVMGLPTGSLGSTQSFTTCQYNPSIGGFVCPSVVRNGLTVSTTYYLYDASGHSQPALDATTTAAIRAVTSVSGSVISTSDTSSGSTLVSQRGDMIMSGLQTDQHVINGTEQAHLEIDFTKPKAIHGTTDLTVKTTSLTVAAAPDPTRAWPLSGKITTDATSNFAGAASQSPSVSRTVLSFDGTSTATMTLSVDGAPALTCRLDLSGSHSLVCP